MSNRFGGEWTLKKLECVKRYLDAYVKVMKNQHNFTTHYIDAFAGTGYVDLRKHESPERSLLDELEEAEEGATAFLEGSAAQSLSVDPKFDNYLFIERNAVRANSLRVLRATRLDLEGRIQIVHGDANEHLQQTCERWPRDHRGVVFLDPFGMQVDWRTLLAISATQRLDMWYLVSVSTINRLMPLSGPPPKEWRTVLRRTFGTDEWVDAVYRPSRQPTLFDDVESDTQRSVDWRRLCGFVLNRLREIFHDGVAPDPLLLRNSTGTPMFLLCFAVSNPEVKARTIALNIANHILGMQ